VAERFGISRAPARKALSLLAEKGLVAPHPRRGYEVRAVAAGEPIEPPEIIGDDTRLASSPSWQQIYGEVEGEIIARIPFGGWRVKEAELARYHGVSRTVARDVVGRLQQRGLVRKDDRSRWYAPALTPQNINELYEVRWRLEPLALEKAAPHVPGAVIDDAILRLRRALDRAEETTGATLDRLENDLHVEILSCCQNATLMRAIGLHQSLLIAHRFLYRWTQTLFGIEPFLPEHMAVLDRLAAGHVAEAASELERHLRASGERAIARVNDVTSRFEPDGLPYLLIEAERRGPSVKA
jgi:DNA-binding GntR family transcriptional regulator